jgi:hypothetical protein
VTRSRPSDFECSRGIRLHSRESKRKRLQDRIARSEHELDCSAHFLLLLSFFTTGAL